MISKGVTPPPLLTPPLPPLAYVNRLNLTSRHLDLLPQQRYQGINMDLSQRTSGYQGK